MAVRNPKLLEDRLAHRKEMQPPIIQLGCQLPFKRREDPPTWSPIDPKLSDAYFPTPTPKDANDKLADVCPKFRNLFEYNIKHKDTYSEGKKLWKIPSIGNNILPKTEKLTRRNSNEDIGLYKPQFDRWYSRIVHENTVILPPLKTSTRLQEKTLDPTDVKEKRYVFKAFANTGPRERFVRNELYLPDVYSECFTCRECQNQYSSDVYIQTLKRRNSKSPNCVSTSTSPQRQRSFSDKRQRCDVLGERYCQSCIERRNRLFSLQVEDSLLNSNGSKKLHYTSRF